MKKKLIAAFTVKDIVFLAIISAVTLCTCAVMPLVVSLQTMIFGIAQVVTSLQIAILFSVGLMKVRKQGALLIMSILTGLFQLLMSPPMFFSNLIIGAIVEVIVYIVYKGYENQKAVFTAVILYNTISLPFSYIYNRLFGREAMAAVAHRIPWLTAVMTLTVIALSALGAWIGIKLSKELKKAGALKR